MIIDFNTLQRKYSKKEVDKHKLQVIGGHVIRGSADGHNGLMQARTQMVIMDSCRRHPKISEHFWVPYDPKTRIVLQTLHHYDFKL